jgi:sugar phosphate isomerase/epimerase
LRLAVSNLAWEEDEDQDALALLVERGVTGVEIAPTKLWPWEQATPAAAEALRASLDERGLHCPALQAVLFGRPDCQLLGDDGGRRKFSEHLGFVAELAAALGAKAVVLGAPKNRVRGERSMDEAMELAVPVLAELGDRYHELGVTLCLEANPEAYDCNFITTLDEAVAAVERADTPGLRLNLDAGTTLINNEPVTPAAVELTAHLHCSQPHLRTFAEPDEGHRRIARAVREASYEGWYSIEMLRGPRGLEDVADAITAINDLYGGEERSEG